MTRLHAGPVLPEKYLRLLLRHAITALLEHTRQLKPSFALRVYRERTAVQSASQLPNHRAKTAWPDHTHSLDSRHVANVWSERSVLQTRQGHAQIVQEELMQVLWVNLHAELAPPDSSQARVQQHAYRVVQAVIPAQDNRLVRCAVLENSRP